MKTHTNNFKNEVKKFGRQLDNIITYTENNEEIELGNEDLNSITPHYEGSILKSVMKQLDIDSNVEIPIGTELNYKFGVKTRKGKNLLGLIVGKTDTINGVTITITPDGYVKLHGTANGNINKSYNWAVAGSTYSSKTYTYSSTYDSGTVSSNFVVNARSGSTQTSTSNQFNPSSLYVNNTLRTTTFTASGNGYITGIQFIINNGVAFNNFIIKLQVEEGNSATEYEKYGKYDYINYGNYIVYSSEKQEDTKSWKITCYDKMLYSMIDYETLEITYPITIRNYLSAICTKLGLTFKNINDTFINYNKQILNELYIDSDGNSLGYKFRDVLDEIAQVTGSTICINEDDDELEIRYITNTNETVDEEYLKDINVNFGEKYGPVNSIVLSRSAESDNVYIKDTQSIEQNGLCEVKIKDNQILNSNNREEFLDGLLQALDGLEYYINDFTSTGITYFDLCDMYNVKVYDKFYKCIMFNNEVNITQGLKEYIYTDMPEQSETDYTKADKTDRRINQTNLIVDKVQGEITSLSSRVIDVSKTQLGTGSITLQNAFETQLHKLVIKGNISVIEPQEGEYGYPLVPRDGLVPSNSLVPSNPVPHSEITVIDDSILMIDNVEYELDFDFLNYIDDNVCDKYVIEDGNCYVIRKIGIDSNGDKYVIDNEVIEPKTPISLIVNKNSTIRLKSSEDAILETTYLLDNPYTNNFTTNYEVKTEIKQAKDEINAQVVGNDEVVSKMNLALREGQGVIEFVSNQFLVQSDNLDIDRYGNTTMKGGNIILQNGSQILGDDGLKSTILVLSNICSQKFVGGSTLLPMGFSYIGQDQYNNPIINKDWLSLEFEIPNDFVITNAKIILTHVPVNYTGYNTETGYCRKLKLYKSSNGLNQGITLNDMYYVFENSNTGYTEVQSAFGQNGFTGNSSYGEETSSIELKDYITTGFNKFKIQSDENTPTTLAQCYQYSGACMATLYITGYTQFNEVGSSNRSLSILNEQSELRSNETNLNEEENNEQTRAINQQLEINNTNKEKENKKEESDI